MQLQCFWRRLGYGTLSEEAIHVIGIDDAYL